MWATINLLESSSIKPQSLIWGSNNINKAVFLKRVLDNAENITFRRAGRTKPLLKAYEIFASRLNF